MRTEFEESVIERHNRILSCISHDLKSPMNAIMGIAGLLADNFDTMPRERALDFLRRITVAGSEALALIEDILKTAKMEAGREGVEPRWTRDLPGELAKVTATFCQEAAAKNIDLSLEIKSPLPPVLWDTDRIRLHVLNNIVSNALRFTPNGGRVLLAAEAEGGVVSLKVEDNGPGVPPEERERIFQRFEHGALSSTRVFSGAGLGLHNARLFTERHGGKIYACESSRLGGACFIMELPERADTETSIGKVDGKSETVNI